MATVHDVFDSATGERVALKRLRRRPSHRRRTNPEQRRRRNIELFEREFHTLCHLAHPRIVAARDYGVDAEGPYYTMELLDGGDLAQLAPLPWPKACSIARDVCSGLSLLHSRRLVYRDLSPRNVRCTGAGLAKLIDFGALAPMGPSKQLIGTPAYCPPEVVNLQPLDARTDLFALGATLYFTLTGRHAYPARSFKRLPTAWRSAPTPPSQFARDVPDALEALVLDLLQLDPGARPDSAAEVMERLAAIEGKPVEEHLLVSQSYLHTPSLVGRDRAVARGGVKIRRALDARGGALLIDGRAGVGRSRLLDACVLNAKLQGAQVLRADAGDGQREYGAVRALFSQLIDLTGELSTRAAGDNAGLLAAAVPEILGDQSAKAAHYGDSTQLRAELLPALRAWLLAVAEARPILVAVDDLHEIDEPSAAFLALLTHEMRRHPLAIAVTVDREALDAVEHPPAAVAMFEQRASWVKLENLSEPDTALLLKSVFGDVPQVRVVAYKLHAISGGNPRDTMQLAQHLVDRGLIRYHAGAWSLPAGIDAADLPSTMADALRARAGLLSTGARRLGRVMALAPDRPITFQDAHVLAPTASGKELMGWLGELLDAQTVKLQGERYELTQGGWVPALLDGADETATRPLHEVLASFFAKVREEDFRAARHLLLAGQIDRALDVLVEHCEASQKATDDNPEAFARLARSMPDDWYACYDRALALCAERHRPDRHTYLIRSRLTGLLARMNVGPDEHLPTLIRQLHALSGLADWDALPAELEPMERLKAALARAQKRHDESAEDDRVLAPIDAIRQLARTVIQETAAITNGIDYERWQKLPSLAPLVPLSPAIGVVETLVAGLGARLAGRFEQARQRYLQLIERIDQPDGAGLDGSHRLWLRLGVLNGLGLLEAAMGLPSALERAAQIEDEPSHRVNAERIRMLYHFWQGETAAADRARKHIDRLRLQNNPLQWFAGLHLLGQVVVTAATEDLTRIRQSVTEIEPLAERYEAWRAVRHYGIGEHHRIRGDYETALEEFDVALSLMGPAKHQLWANAAGARVRALFALERDEEAAADAHEYLATADAADLGYARAFIRMPLAIVEARRGNYAEARELAAEALAEFEALGCHGILPALAEETLARVALQGGDSHALERHAASCLARLSPHASGAVVARYERFSRTAARLGPDPHSGGHAPLTSLTTILEACKGDAARAEQGLRYLLQRCGAHAGVLYTLSEHGPKLAARIGDGDLPPDLLVEVRHYLNQQAQETATCTDTCGQDESIESSYWATREGHRYQPILLSHQGNQGVAITGVALVELGLKEAFTHPGPVVAELSRVAAAAEDVAPTIVQG